jgi:hypothetical protein
MDMNNTSTQLTLRDYPIFLWLFGLAFFIPTIFIFFMSGREPLILIFSLIGLAMLLLPSVNTITLDRSVGTATLRSQNLLRNKVQEIPLREIANFEIQSSRSSSDSSTTFRIAVVKTSGERIPLSGMYSSGYNSKAKKARKLCEFLGLPGWEDGLGNFLQTAIQAQAAATRRDNVQSGTTSGIAWRFETLSAGGQPVTRWVSQDYAWPGNFLLLAQKPKGSPSILGGGLLGSVAQMIFQQIIGIYGFTPGDTPGIETSGSMKPGEPRLEQDYAILTSDSYGARIILNGWCIPPLERWARQHPMRTVSSGNQAGQLVALFSAQGTILAVLGNATREVMDEMISLGVDLIKSQGTQAR